MTLDWQPPTLESERLRLRPMQARDAPAVFMYSCNPKMTKYTLWDTHQSINDSLWFVTEMAFSRYSNQEPDPLGIVLKNDPEQLVIGSIGVFWVSKLNDVMELGYSLAEPYWGRGLVVEAATVVLDYVFREYPVIRLQARIFAGNTASERVVEKLGFQREGVLRSLIRRHGQAQDVIMYSLLRSEWENA